MKRPGLNRNSLLATLFLVGLAPHAPAFALDVLDALPPKPAARPAPEPAKTPDVSLPKPSQTPPKAETSAPAVKPPAPPAEAFRARVLEKFDRNKDGRLDDDERAAAKKFAEENNLRPDGPMRAKLAKKGGPAEVMRAELLRRFDRDANGKIDDPEMTDLEKAVRERFASAPSVRQRYDHNGDGQLDDAEWSAARPRLQQWLNEPEPPSPKK